MASGFRKFVWDDMGSRVVSGTQKMGPLYGKFPILFPYL